MYIIFAMKNTWDIHDPFQQKEYLLRGDISLKVEDASL